MATAAAARVHVRAGRRVPAARAGGRDRRALGRGRRLRGEPALPAAAGRPARQPAAARGAGRAHARPHFQRGVAVPVPDRQDLPRAGAGDAAAHRARPTQQRVAASTQCHGRQQQQPHLLGRWQQQQQQLLGEHVSGERWTARRPAATQLHRGESVRGGAHAVKQFQRNVFDRQCRQGGVLHALGWPCVSAIPVSRARGAAQDELDPGQCGSKQADATHSCAASEVDAVASKQCRVHRLDGIIHGSVQLLPRAKSAKAHSLLRPAMPTSAE
ncbi:hypothetical protein ON010_g6367 [Phytophthora cinnamomi]|nr:hypothetical protein ON010_g6367 [Phytophthora cinnamomi]